MEQNRNLERKEKRTATQRKNDNVLGGASPWLVVGGAAAALLIGFVAYNNLPDLIRYIKIERM